VGTGGPVAESYPHLCAAPVRGIPTGGTTVITISHRHRLAAALLAAAVVGLTLAGCGAGSGPNASSGEAAPARAPADAAGGGGGVPGTRPDTPKLPPAQPKSVVYNGDLSLVTAAVDRVADQATALATGAGGQIGSDQRSGQGPAEQASLVLRVPATAFYPTISALAKLGTETDRKVGSQDVTGQVIDLDSRITTAQASLNRTRALFSRAQAIGDIVTLEQQLSDRETALETLLGQKKALDDQISLSTITIRITAVPAPAKPEVPTGFGAGLVAGWTALVSSLNVVATILGALLPFAAAIGIPVAVLWFFWRRRHPRQPALAGTPASLDPTSKPDPSP
jgi:hypothetical protein